MARGSERRRALGVLLLPPAVAALAGTPTTGLAALSGPARDALGTGPLVAALGLLAWALTGWLALVVVIDLGARLPGLLGSAARTCLTRVAPASVRAVVRTATGAAVASAVLLSGTAHADPARAEPPRTTSATTATATDLDWPTASTTPSATAAATPAATSPPAAAPTSPAAEAPLRAVTIPALPAPAVPAPVLADPAAPQAGIVVRPGDCLWHLAARALGPAATPRQVADAWPTWWSANRAVIGDDPDLLRPGTTLLPPTSQPRP